MGNLKVDLGPVQYDSDSMLPPVPLAAQIGLGAGAAAIILMVLVVILMYRCVSALWSGGLLSGTFWESGCSVSQH